VDKKNPTHKIVTKKQRDSQTLMQELLEKRKQLSKGGGDQRIAAQHAKGKLTARERILKLLDDGSFQEIDSYWTHRHQDFGLDEKKFPGDSVVVGFGKIDGRMVCVYSQDFTVLGGSFSEVQGQKVAKVLDLAMDSGVPVIGLMDSVGARIQEGVYSLAAFSELFYRNTQASGVIPQISVMLGPCAGGSVYSPGLTDFVIMTQGKSHMFITGPDVIKTVTGEDVDIETLGGDHVHGTISGVSHFSAVSEEHALEITRQLISYLPLNNAEPAPARSPQDDPWRMDQRLNHIHGQVVGIVANQPLHLAGVLDIDASDKIARFIRFCDAFNIPLITFVDTPGFMPGVKQEYGGIIRHGAKIVYAYSEATVPKIAVITRKAYGGAYIVMSSKYIRTDMVFGWPTAEIAVIGADGAVNILYAKQLKNAENAAEVKAKLVEEFTDKFSGPYLTAASGHLDDILVPAESRSRLIAALELLRDKRVSAPTKKHGNIPL